MNTKRGYFKVLAGFFFLIFLASGQTVGVGDLIDQQVRLDGLVKKISMLERVRVSSDTRQALINRQKLIGLRTEKVKLEKEIKKLEDAKKKKESPEEKKATAEQRKFEKKNIAVSKETGRVLRNAAIEGCPNGGVNVSPWATGSYSPRRFVKVRIVNDSGIFINDIVETHKNQVAVKGLCSTGAVSLFETTGFDDIPFSYRYIATTVVDGVVYRAESQSFDLASQSIYNYREDNVWHITFPNYHPPQPPQK